MVANAEEAFQGAQGTKANPPAGEPAREAGGDCYSPPGALRRGAAPLTWGCRPGPHLAE